MPGLFIARRAAQQAECRSTQAAPEDIAASLRKPVRRREFLRRDASCYAALRRKREHGIMLIADGETAQEHTGTLLRWSKQAWHQICAFAKSIAKRLPLACRALVMDAVAR